MDYRWFARAALFVAVPAAIGLILAFMVPNVELQRSLFTGATGLLFVGFFGGLLKITLDDLAAARRKREDVAGFVSNVLSDLKQVYDRVGRAQLLIPAHRSVKTYGEEMRGLIEARVQLRNVARALERRAEGVREPTRVSVIRAVANMEAYLEGLAEEFKRHYKALSDRQRGYERRAEVLLKRYAEREGEGDQPPPELPGFVWAAIGGLEGVSDFIERGEHYKMQFEVPLDDASEQLRAELALIMNS